MSNTDTRLEEQIRETIKENVWGYCCKACSGGGADGQDTCTECNGLGIVGWETDLAVSKITTLISQELSIVENHWKEKLGSLRIPEYGSTALNGHKLPILDVPAYSINQKLDALLKEGGDL